MKKIFYLSILSLALSACGIKSGGDGKAPVSPVPPGSKPPVTGVTGVAASVSSQPSLNAILGIAMADDIVFKFTDSSGSAGQVPATKSYTIKPYKDQDCSIPAVGTLTYSTSVSGGDLKLSNLKYSRAEDVYVGISGTTLKKACSNVINVMSAGPATFGFIQGYGQSGYVGQVLPETINMLVLDAQDRPVKNVRIKVGDQISNPSDSSGIASINYKLGGKAGSVVIPSILSFNGIEIHRIELGAYAYSESPTKIEIYYQEDPTILEANQPSDPIFLRAFDSYGNIINPEQWFYSWEFYSDSKCTVPGPEQVWNQLMVNPVYDPEDPESWMNLYFYAFEEIGNVYIKFILLNAQGGVQDSVCSNKIIITAPQN